MCKYIDIKVYFSNVKQFLTHYDVLIDMSDTIIIQSIANPDKYGIDGSDSAALTKQGSENGDVDKSSPGLTNMDALRIQEYPFNKTDSLERAVRSSA